MKNIVLATINARYTHSSAALRYLYANLQELQDLAIIQEYDISDNPQQIAEQILVLKPKLLCLGIYIWNALESFAVIEIVKKVYPEIFIILGGPEVSYQPFRVDFSRADYIIQGEGEIAFYNLAKELLNNNRPSNRIFSPQAVDLEQIKLPYAYYTEDDIKNRIIYVEASRGCAFNCEFCLSSIDKQVRYFNLDKVLAELDKLWQRGCRSFKFVDRTFNLDIKVTNRILDFFLNKPMPYFAHFEIIPEHFPEDFKQKIRLFPAKALQLEVGIQTLNPQVAQNIKRNLNMEKIEKNLVFLETRTNAHLHVDLIVGLPGQTIQSFADDLNKLVSIISSKIQLGVLKKLSGTTISRHDQIHGMVYSDLPPYDILKNDLISYEQIQKLKRMARFWEITYNSGNFSNSIKLLWPEGDVFKGFFGFCEWAYNQTQSTYQISLNRLAELLFMYIIKLQPRSDKEKTELANLMVDDILKRKLRKIPGFLREYASEIPIIKKSSYGI
ncbi:MAG: B12-binding domain-containing radical SAM protein [Candidatus Omnitrophica bacterium]|nr:B12-binding domain-containing radical SAM protein [Candidatus Omnitrophota bacterium]